MGKSHLYKPVRFYAVTNAIMWASWLAAAWLSYRPGGGPAKVISLLGLIGLFSPMATAVWMIRSSKSADLKRDFLTRLFDLRLIRPWTVPVIFLLMPAVIVVSVVLSRVFFGHPMSQLLMVQGSPFAAGIIPAQALLVLAPIIEEIGWKGYGMESLRGRRSFLAATVAFAALWAFWHGPTFFVRDYYQNMLVRTNVIFAVNFVVSFLPATVIFNWLWYKNRGSILTAILCHGMIDFQGMLRMGQAAKCIETLVMAVVAAAIVVADRKAFFGIFRPEIGYYGDEALAGRSHGK